MHPSILTQHSYTPLLMCVMQVHEQLKVRFEAREDHEHWFAHPPLFGERLLPFHFVPLILTCAEPHIVKPNTHCAIFVPHQQLPSSRLFAWLAVHR